MKKNILTLLTGLILSCTAFSGVEPKESKDGSDHNFNLTFAPISLLVGLVQLEGEYKVSPSWTVGLDYLSWNLTIGNWGLKALGYGAQATWYSNGVYRSSWYLTPTIQSLSVTASYSSSISSGSATATALYGGVVGGYGWFWHSFDLNLGLSLIQGLGSTSVTVSDSSGNKYSQTFPLSAGIEFRIGWTF